MKKKQKKRTTKIPLKLIFGFIVLITAIFFVFPDTLFAFLYGVMYLVRFLLIGIAWIWRFCFIVFSLLLGTGIALFVFKLIHKKSFSIKRFFLLAFVIGVVMTLLLTVKINLEGTASYSSLTGPFTYIHQPNAYIKTDNGNMYALSDYKTSFYFQGKRVRVNGLMIGLSQFQHYGWAPFIWMHSYQILNTRTDIEGYLTVEKDKLYVNESLSVTSKYKVLLKGKDVEKLKWVVEKLIIRKKNLPYFQGRGNGYYQQNSLQELFNITSYTLRNRDSTVNLEQLFAEYNSTHK